MTDNFIPMFKKSGDGNSKDLLKLKKLEIISEGWYKGQLIKYMDAVFGRTVVDGVLVYKEEAKINGSTKLSDQSTRGKNVKKLLRLWGMSDSTLTSIYKVYKSEGVDKIYLNFKKEIDIDSIQSKENIKKAWKILKEELVDAVRFEFTHSNKWYKNDIISRPAVKSSDIFNTSAWTTDDDYFDQLSTPIEIRDADNGTTIVYPIVERNFKISQAMYFSSVKIFNSLNEDITNEYNKVIIKALQLILLISGEKAFEFVSIEKLEEEEYKYKIGEIFSEIRYIIKAKEIYNNIPIAGFTDNEYNKYSKGELDTKTSDGEIYSYNGILANHLWAIYTYDLMYKEDRSDNIFYYPKKYKNLSLSKRISLMLVPDDPNVRYMSIEGIKKNRVSDITTEIAKYANFRIKKEEKKGFMGIGGFVGKFLGGLFKAIIGIVTTLSKIAYHIPMLRLSIQFIGWVFSGKWSNDKDRFVQISNRVVLAVIAVLIVIATGGSGFQVALSLLASAYGMYSGLEKFDNIVESVEKQKKLENKNKQSDKEIAEKLIDFSQSDDAKNTNEILYKPFDSINNTYKSPFSDNKIYSPKFGL